MAYKFAILDPRPIPAAIEANDKVFASGPVYGVEVTVPALAKRCTFNLDPQHTGGDASRAAIEYAVGLVVAHSKGRPCCGGGWDSYYCPRIPGCTAKNRTNWRTKLHILFSRLQLDLRASCS